MKTIYDYDSSVLNIEISGLLVGSKVQEFESEAIPIVLGLKASNISIDLSRVDLIDKGGINSLIKLSNIAYQNKGKLVLYNLNGYIKNTLKHSDIFDYCYKSKNKKTSLEVFKI